MSKYSPMETHIMDVLLKGPATSADLVESVYPHKADRPFNAQIIVNKAVATLGQKLKLSGEPYQLQRRKLPGRRLLENSIVAMKSKGRRDWRKSLTPQERVELKEFDRKIKRQQRLAEQDIREREKLIVLKYRRKMLQNRATVRARRLEAEMTPASAQEALIASDRILGRYREALGVALQAVRREFGYQAEKEGRRDEPPVVV
jgi:hypothetical protein